jgi:tetratricopeptide (TPR) repeat protein
MRGLIAEQRGDLLAAERLLLDALASNQTLGSQANQMTLLGDLGAVAQRLQHFERAADYYQRSLDLAEQLGSQPQQAICANNLGLLSLERSWPAQARQWFERELELATALDRLDLQSYARLGLARVLEIDYRFADALELAEQALALQEQLESHDRAAAEQLVGRLRRRAERR